MRLFLKCLNKFLADAFTAFTDRVIDLMKYINTFVILLHF